MAEQEPSDPPASPLPDKPLSNEDRIEVFKIATRSLVHRHGDKFKVGMSTEELEHALEKSLGIFGGSGSIDRLNVSHKGAGLKIWGGWHIVNHVQEAPLFQGKATIAMAREVYGIGDPDDGQMSLL